MKPLKLLLNKSFVLALLFLLVQQIIVASSTFWISYLSEAVVTGYNIRLYLYLFVGSLFLVYIPGFFSSYFFEIARAKSLLEYSLTYAKSYSYLTSFLNDKKLRDEKEPWLTSESSKTLEESYHLVYDAISLILNMSLNVLALCFAIDSRLLLGYLICAIIIPCIAKYFKKNLTETGIGLQNSRKDLSQVTLSGWDNILTGNTYNLTIWIAQFRQKWLSYKKATIKNTVINLFSSNLTMVCSLLPVMAFFILIFSSTNDVTKMAALIATLPRQIQIIQHLDVFVRYVMYWHGAYAKLKALDESLIPPVVDLIELKKRIQFSNFSFYINGQKFDFADYEDFIEKLGKTRSGRVTICGANGSGKSTLLHLVKQILEGKAFYLAAVNNLLFKGTDTDAFSTGQRVMKKIEEASSILEPSQILLLDEWDANLDNKNIERISSSLDMVAAKNCIVEVRHRYTPSPLVYVNI